MIEDIFYTYLQGSIEFYGIIYQLLIILLYVFNSSYLLIG